MNTSMLSLWKTISGLYNSVSNVRGKVFVNIFFMSA